MQDFVAEGAAAYQAGDRARAKHLFVQATEANPFNGKAWLWLSEVVDTPTEKRYALKKALGLDPNNAAIKADLEKVDKIGSVVQSAPPKAAPPKANPIALVLLLAATIGLCAIVYGMGSGTRRTTPSALAPTVQLHSVVSVGTETRLKSSAEDVLVATTDAAWDAMFKAIIAKDNEGLAQLVLNGQVLLVPTNTKVRVIDTGVTSMKVRVLEGTYYGQSGWVPREMIEE